MVETVYCVHCGAVAKHPVTKVIQSQSLIFCCTGCVQVYEFMREDELLNDLVPQAAPIKPPVLIQSNPSSATQTFSFHVVGMFCANCVATVERHLHSVPGVMEVSVVLSTEQATVKTIPNRVAMIDLKQAVEKVGYTLIPWGNA